MATQICPNCGRNAITWSVDEEESPFTFWGCNECLYHAYEDELKARVCGVCGKTNEMYMMDEVKTYWWCCTCNHVTEIPA